MKKFLSFYIAAFMLFFVASAKSVSTTYSVNSNPMSSISASLPELTASQKANVYLAAKDRIKSKCKFPNTCDFPKLYDTDAVKFVTDRDMYGLSVKFKAENSFGQKCNMTAIVIFKMEKGKPIFVLVEVE